jgi:hypothetical protein
VLFTTVFITSCNKDGNSPDLALQQTFHNENGLTPVNNCNKPFHNVESYSAGAHVIQNLIYVEKDYDKVNNLDTKEKYFNHYNNLSSDNVNAMATMSLHGQKYKDLGHDGYIDFATSQGLLSQDLNLYFKSFRSSFVSFINTNQPNFDAFKSYIESRGLELASNITLCDYDKYVAKVYHVTLLGIGKYLYDTHYNFSSNIITVDPRASCEGFWQKLACGTGGAIVSSLVGVGLGVVKWVKSVFTGKDEKGNDVNLLLALFEVYKIAVAQWKIGVTFYEWCCDTLFGNDIVKCGDPTGCWAMELGCNNYELNVVGPGLYTITNWNNSNTIPSAAVTPVPRLKVTIPDVTAVSVIQGNTLCTDENGNMLKSFAFNRQIGGSSPFPNPVWGNSPPSTAVRNQSYQVSVTNPPLPGDLYTMSLSSGFGYSFMLITGGMMNFTGYSPGTYNVEVTYTHVCTGETHKVSKSVTVTN